MVQQALQDREGEESVARQIEIRSSVVEFDWLARRLVNYLLGLG
jgi:hypothetical protein